MNRHDYAHHPGFADPLAAGFLVSTSLSNPGWKALICWHGLRRPVILITASPPSCSRVPRGREQIDPSGGDVLPELSGVDVEPVLADLSEQLSVDEVDLPQVRLRWVGGDPRSVLDGDALVGVVALHSESRHQHDLVDDCLAEAVFTIAADGEHPSLLIGHPAKSPRLLPGEEPASESDGTPAGTLGADRLSAVEEVENAAGEKRSCLGVIGRQRTVGEVVLIAGV